MRSEFSKSTVAMGTLGVALAASQATSAPADVPFQVAKVATDGATLATYQAGAGSDTALVFLHGDSGRASQWFAVMELMVGEAHVVGFDQRGHGASSSAEDFGYDARARDLAAVIEAGGHVNVVLIAHSASAGVALGYAADQGDKVRAIYFLDPATDPRAMPEDMRQGFLGALASRDALGAVQGYYASIAGGDGEVIATVQADAAEVTPEARLGVATALLDWNPEAALADWNGPVFALITPANDNPASIRHLRAGFPYAVAETHGHWPQLDAPDMVAASIRSFLAGLD